MMPTIKVPYWRKLEADLGDVSGIIVPKGKDEAAYFEMLRSTVRQGATSLEIVSATGIEPGFDDRAPGSTESRYLLAQRNGYWLVYEPHEGTYYRFWEATQRYLGAHGVRGNPLYCWGE